MGLERGLVTLIVESASFAEIVLIVLDSFSNRRTVLY